METNLYPGLKSRKQLLTILTGTAAVIALINFIMRLSALTSSVASILGGLLGIAAPVVALLFVMNIAKLQEAPLNKFAIPGVLGVITLQHAFTAIDFLTLPTLGFGFVAVVYVIMALVYAVVALCFGSSAYKLFMGKKSSKLILLATIIVVIMELLALLIGIIAADVGFGSLLIACVLELVFTLSLYGGLYLLLQGDLNDVPFANKF